MRRYIIKLLLTGEESTGFKQGLEAIQKGFEVDN